MTTFKDIADKHIQASKRKFKTRLMERLDIYKKETIRDVTMRINRTFDGIAAQVERDFETFASEAVEGFLGFEKLLAPKTAPKAEPAAKITIKSQGQNYNVNVYDDKERNGGIRAPKNPPRKSMVIANPHAPKASWDYMKIADMFHQYVATHPDEKHTKRSLMTEFTLQYSHRHRVQRALKHLVDEGRLERIGSPSAPSYRLYEENFSKLPPPPVDPDVDFERAANDAPRTFRVTAGQTDSQFD